MKKYLQRFLLVALCALAACEETQDTPPVIDDGGTTTPLPDNDNLLMGKPSDAGTDENNYRIDKTYYTMSYNRGRALPNWVSWYVGPTTLGTATTTGTLKADTLLPAGWYRAQHYSGSSFVEAQNSPAGHHTQSVDAVASTYLMTNMTPLVPEGAAPWKAAADYIRSLVGQGQEAYVISGNYGTGGISTTLGSVDKINDGQVTVPAHIWVAALILPLGEDDLNRMSTGTRIIALDLPNDGTTMPADWWKNRVSVDALEEATGYDLFSALPNGLEALIEARIDDVVIGPGTDPNPEPDNSHILFGNISNATTSVANENNYLMVKTWYVLSYNRSRATPNWVCWHLGRTDIATLERKDNFRQDPDLPQGWYRVGDGSYSGSGFNRGHNCPNGDRTVSREAANETFLMTNIIPQAGQNNGTIWGGLENYTRSQVTAGGEAYVIMGSYGRGGSGDKGPAETIDNGNIVVPSNVWKVVVFLPEGNNDLNRVTTSTRVIAINTLNVNSGLTQWYNYRVTVDEIEAATGYDILSFLPDDIESVLEAKVDEGSVN